MGPPSYVCWFKQTHLNTFVSIMHQLVVIVITMGPHRVWIEHDYVFLDINIMIVYGYGMLIFFTTRKLT